MQHRRDRGCPAPEGPRTLRLVQNRHSRPSARPERLRRLRFVRNVLLLVAALVTASLVFLAMMTGR